MYIFSKSNFNFLQKSLFIVFFSIATFLYAIGQDLSGQLQYFAYGTGNTTGHVITVNIYNPNPIAFAVEIGNCFVPSGKGSQGYIIPGSKSIFIPPLKSVEVPLTGFCVNGDKSPPQLGDKLLPVEEWVSWTEAYPFPEPGQELAEPFMVKPEQVISENDQFILTYPNSEIPFNYTIDVNKHPKEATRLLLHYLSSAEQAFDMLSDQGKLQIEPHMREGIIQQVIWMYVSALEGKIYNRNIFLEKFTQNWQESSNIADENLPSEAVTEAENIWESISLVGIEAKAIPTDIRGSENLFREIPEGPEMPIRNSVIEILNQSDYRSDETGKILIPLLQSMYDKKDDPDWSFLFHTTRDEWKKWLDYQIGQIKPGDIEAMEKLIEIRTMISYDGNEFLSDQEREQFISAVNDGLNQVVSSQIKVLDNKDSDYIQKWRSMYSWLDAEWYQGCCSLTRPLDALPEKFPSNLRTATGRDIPLHGPGWKFTAPPVVISKSLPDWIIPAAAVPVIGVGTWIVIRNGDGTDTTAIPFPMAVNDNITIACDGQGSLNVLTNDSGQGIRLISVQELPQVSIEFTENGDVLILGLGPIGTFTTVYTIEDQAGRTAMAEIVITVTDLADPTIQCPPDIVISFGTEPDPDNTGRPVVSDNCTPEDQIVVEYSDSVEGEGCWEIITREWKATDLAGNESFCLHVISFQDDEDPVITCPPDIEVDCTEYKDTDVTGVATAEDNCTADVPVSFTDNPEEFSGCSMTIIRTWTAIDEANNTSICEQILFVTDETPPVFTLCPSDVTVECGEEDNLDITGRPEAEDACNDIGELSFTDEIVFSDGCTKVIIRTFTVDDNCENTAECLQQITVTDTQPPVISCPDNLNVQCGQENDLTITGLPIAEDNCGGEVSVIYSDDLTNITACNGNIIRTFIATDQCGNSASCDQLIFVENIPCSFVPLFNVVNDVCNSCTGQAGVTVLSPENFTYLWSNGSTEPVISGLCSGLYTLSITDEVEGCTDIYNVEVQNDDEELQLAVIQINNPSSEFSADGFVILQVQTPGATPPFVVYVNGMAIGMVNTPNFEIINLPAGEYIIYIVDSNGEGCPSNEVFVLLIGGSSVSDNKPYSVSWMQDMPSLYPVSVHNSISEMPDRGAHYHPVLNNLHMNHALSVLIPLGQNYHLRAKFQRINAIVGYYGGSPGHESIDFYDEMIGAGLRQIIPLGNSYQLFHEGLLGARQYNINSQGYSLTGSNMIFEYSIGLQLPLAESVRVELSGSMSINYLNEYSDYSFYGGMKILHDLSWSKSLKKPGKQISFPDKRPELINNLR